MKKFRKTDAPLNVAVIGGGPSGMMAAGTAAKRGHRVTLFEKNNKLGRKLAITGKGRANITNDCDVQEIIKNIPKNGKFLYSALSAFTPADVMEFFEGRGVPIKVERGRRVFPASDKAFDVVDAMVSYVRENGTRIINTSVAGIERTEGGKFIVKTLAGSFSFDTVIIATGGKSYPATGSTGDGYKFAKNLGHSVTPIRPSLVPLVSKQSFCAQMQGLSLRNISIKLYCKNTLIYEDFGEILFTHFGLSGPLILSASAYITHTGDAGDCYIMIDLKPALDEETLDRRILRDFEKHSNKELPGALSDLLHKSMVPVIIDLWGVDVRKKAHSVTRKERKELVHLLKGLRVDIAALRPIEEAVVTAGGVKTSEIKPSTMESKLVPSLFFAGEVIDVDAMTGGYNLQIAWSTGFLAGNSV